MGIVTGRSLEIDIVSQATLQKALAYVERCERIQIGLVIHDGDYWEMDVPKEVIAKEMVAIAADKQPSRLYVHVGGKVLRYGYTDADWQGDATSETN